MNELPPQARKEAQRGSRLLKENRFCEAAGAFREAIVGAPDNAELWTNLGIAQDRAGSVSEAVDALEHSVSISRKQPDVWLSLGLAHRKLGALETAEKAYCVALELEPENATAWQCLGLLKEQLRDYPAAIECLAASAKFGGGSAALWGNLGKLLYQCGRVLESYDAFVQAANMDGANGHFQKMLRRTRFLRDILQGASVNDALAVSLQGSVPTAEPSQDLAEWLEAAFSIFSGFGHLEAALRVGQKHRELWPENRSMEYLMDAVVGTPRVDRSSPGYIVEHFDEFAERFDEQLVGVLGYDVPEKLCSMAKAALSPGRQFNILDVGCGTGLCGPFLRPLARTLAGVDLSPKMVEQSIRRGVYDRVFCDEIVTFLEGSTSRFGAVIAADVVIYFGDLAPLFAAAGTALQPEGIFAFSTELWTGEKYRLGPSGRFAHAPEYVRSQAGRAFVEHACLDTTLRLQGAGRARGNLFVFRKKL